MESIILILVYCSLASLLMVISQIDRREYRIPDRVTKPWIATFTFLFHQQHQLLLIAWLWLAGMYLVTALAPTTLGRGDVKLIAALTLTNGYFQITTPTTFLMVLLFLSSVIALPGAIRAHQRQEKYPFAPALSGACLLIFGIGAI